MKMTQRQMANRLLKIMTAPPKVTAWIVSRRTRQVTNVLITRAAKKTAARATARLARSMAATALIAQLHSHACGNGGSLLDSLGDCAEAQLLEWALAWTQIARARL
jgi:hypothetical protein